MDAQSAIALWVPSGLRHPAPLNSAISLSTSHPSVRVIGLYAASPGEVNRYEQTQTGPHQPGRLGRGQSKMVSSPLRLMFRLDSTRRRSIPVWVVRYTVPRSPAAGYRVALYHVNVRRAEMSIARVAARVAVGGHPVPQDNIRERYERDQPLIRRAAERATVTLLFDNSKRGVPPQWLLTLEYGAIVAQTTRALPAWAAQLYL